MALLGLQIKEKDNMEKRGADNFASNSIVARFLLALMLMSILFFAFLPGHYTPSFLSGQDKLNHVVAFFSLTLLSKHAFSAIKNYRL